MSVSLGIYILYTILILFIVILRSTCVQYSTVRISQLTVFCPSPVAVFIFLFNISDLTMPKDKQPLSRRLKTFK